MENGATGFLVAIGDPPGATYLVTAKHVAQELRQDPFAIGYNGRDGLAKIDHIDGAEWYSHPRDDTIDIAVMEYEAPSDADCVYFPERSFLSDEKIESADFGAGDPTYMVGLFQFVKGQRRNRPVVHAGNIALMLEGDERIPVEDWNAPKGSGQIKKVRAHVVEAHALQGSSGSPVFVRRPEIGPVTDFQDGYKDSDRNKAWRRGVVFLLGLWQGSWDAPPGEVLSAGKPEGVRVPVGMGVVVPAKDILAVLNRDDLVSRRKAKEEADLRARAASLDTALPTTDENPRHREDFSRLLDAAVKGPRPSGKT